MASVSWKPTSPFLPLFPLTEKKCFVNAPVSLSGSLYAGTVYIVYSLRIQCHTLPYSNYSAKHTVFLWLKCFFEILPTKKRLLINDLHTTVPVEELFALLCLADESALV